MKILKRIFVFALFAFAAVLAFGAINVKAAATEVARFEFGTNDPSITDETGQDGTQANTYTEESGTYTLTLSSMTKVYQGSYDANGNACLKLGTSSATGSFEFTVPEDVEQVVILVAGYKANTVTVNVNGNTTPISTKSADGEYTEVIVDTTSTKTVTFTTSTNKRCKVDAIVYYDVADNTPQLDTPVATMNNKVVSWNAVSGAVSYKVGVFSSEDGTSTNESFATDVTSYDLSGYTPQGTWFIKVQALGDGNTILNSEWSNSAGTIDNGTEAYEITIAQALALEIPTFNNPVKYSITGTVSSIYQEYNSQYGNVSLNITDGERTIVAFRAIGDFASKVDAGAVVTVEGILTTYHDVNQLAQGCEIVECTLADCAVGVQYADAGDGKQHARLVGKLNVNYQDVLSLSFTITDANDPSKTTTIVVTNVFGTLTANNESGVVEITAASLGVQSLFALTITNIPAGTTLNVTATFTTAGGTYTSAVKTVEVAAAE